MRLSSASAGVCAGQWRWRWDLNPRKTCAFTRFRVLRLGVHHRPPASLTSTDWWPVSPGERSRTGVNETQTEPRSVSGASPNAHLQGGCAVSVEAISWAPNLTSVLAEA